MPIRFLPEWFRFLAAGRRWNFDDHRIILEKPLLDILPLGGWDNCHVLTPTVSTATVDIPNLNRFPLSMVPFLCSKKRTVQAFGLSTCN
jgi:hypothetical protein